MHRPRPPTGSALPSLLLALTLAAAGPAVASHLAAYHTNPLEHEHQGSSAEPDAVPTSVLGPSLMNCVFRLAPGAPCTPDPHLMPPAAGQAHVLAPGCTDDSGRQLEGMCGLWSIGAGVPVAYSTTPELRLVTPGTAGVQGMSGAAAPGRFSPSKSAAITFLDARLDARLLPGGPATIDVNKKFQSLGADALLEDVLDCSGCKPGFTAGIWAWFGTWMDKNGNGVIDHHTRPATASAPCPSKAPGAWCATSLNEFVWRGSCLRVSGAPNAANAAKDGYCTVEPLSAVDFLYPGDHEADCTRDAYALGPICDSGVQAPGLAVVRFVGEQNGLLCPEDPPSSFALDIDCDGAGTDPVFDDPSSVHYDVAWTDTTGEPQQDARLWSRGSGGVSLFYDGSVFVTMLQVTAFGCPPSGNANGVDLERCAFLDVDRSQSFHPLTQQYFGGVIQPAARGQWLLLRNALFPIPLPPPPPLGGAPVPVGADLTIKGKGADLPVVANPMQLACGPLAWDGAVAEVTCDVSLVVLPPGYEWRCIEPSVSVLAEATGAASVRGTIACDGGSAHSCTANAAAAACASPPSTEAAAFPVTCRAEVAAAAQLGQWAVRCRAPGP